MQINATIQYPPCSTQIITESAETTKIDFQEGFEELSKNINTSKYKQLLSSEFSVRSLLDFENNLIGDQNLDDYQNVDSLQFIYHILNETILLNELEPSPSFTFFKLVYLKFSFYPPKFKLIKDVESSYDDETDSIIKRSLRKIYFWMLNCTERIYGYYNIFRDNCDWINQLMTELRQEEFSMEILNKKFLSTITHNLKCVYALEYMCHVFKTIQNPGIGTTTSRLALFTIYHLSGCLHRLHEKHMKIHQCLLKHFTNEDPKILPDYHHRILGDSATIITLIDNNIQTIHFCMSTIVYFTECFLPVICKIVTNRKTSHSFPIEFSVFDFDDRYHLKTLICFNTDDTFMFYGSSHVGTADYFDTDLPDIIYQLNSDTDKIGFLTFCGEISNKILRTVLARMNAMQYQLAILWVDLVGNLKSPDEFDDKIMKKATNNLAKFNYFIDKRNKEGVLQISYLSIYSNITMTSLKVLIGMDVAVASLKTGVTRNTYTKIVFGAYKYIYKNLFDFVYYAIYRISKFIFYFEMMAKTGGNRDWSEIYHKQYVTWMLHYIKNELESLGENLWNNPGETSPLYGVSQQIEEFIQKENNCLADYRRNLIEIRNAFMLLENFTANSKIRLTFRKDRSF